jgi:hypothetical protein
VGGALDNVSGLRELERSGVERGRNGVDSDTWQHRSQFLRRPSDRVDMRARDPRRVSCSLEDVDEGTKLSSGSR